MFLRLTVASDADLLVSGDADLLALADTYPIVSTQTLRQRLPRRG